MGGRIATVYQRVVAVHIGQLSSFASPGAVEAGSVAYRSYTGWSLCAGACARELVRGSLCAGGGVDAADVTVGAVWVRAGVGGAGHFLMHGNGQRNPGHGGDMFRGRGAVLAVLRDWLTAPACAGVPLVVCGRPGAGKSAVVSRAIRELELMGYGRGLAWHARSGVRPSRITIWCRSYRVAPHRCTASWSTRSTSRRPTPTGIW